MPEEYVLQPPPAPTPPPPPPKKIPVAALIAAAVVGLVLVLTVGVIIGRLTTTPTKQAAVLIPTPTPTPIDEDGLRPTPTIVSEIPVIKFLPGKQYLDDTYVAVETKAPHTALILSVSRIEQERNFTEYTKSNYFNGTSWSRKVVTSFVPTATIATNPLLRSWNQANTPSDTERPLATVELPEGIISLSSTGLTNEVSVQSLPGLTKFIYQGKGSLTYGGERHEAYVFYSRTYSFNALDLAFLTKPEQLSSQWMLFWDNEGSFYYLDSHSVPNATSAVQNLRIGIKEDTANATIRTNAATLSQSIEKDQKIYTVDFDQPLKEKILLPVTNIVNKADKRSYSWILNIAEGNVVKREGRLVPGIGIAEVIKPN